MRNDPRRDRQRALAHRLHLHLERDHDRNNNRSRVWKSSMTLFERFNTKYRIAESGGCWLWTACLYTDGYGQIRTGSFRDKTRRIERAHRVSWELHNGPVPEGLCVLHRCDVPSCVNPAHLWLGTNADNMADKAAKNRAASGEANGSARLTAKQVAQIRRINRAMTQCKIADCFSISQAQVSRIINGQHWRMKCAL